MGFLAVKMRSPTFSFPLVGNWGGGVVGGDFEIGSERSPTELVPRVAFSLRATFGSELGDGNDSVPMSITTASILETPTDLPSELWPQNTNPRGSISGWTDDNRALGVRSEQRRVEVGEMVRGTCEQLHERCVVVGADEDE
jgi:hypothetical protein